MLTHAKTETIKLVTHILNMSIPTTIPVFFVLTATLLLCPLRRNFICSFHLHTYFYRYECICLITLYNFFLTTSTILISMLVDIGASYTFHFRHLVKWVIYCKLIILTVLGEWSSWVKNPDMFSIFAISI